MGQVVVTIAGRTFRMNCEDGQEDHLQRLAADIDARTGALKQNFGEIGTDRLVVMSALTVADDLDTARRRIAELEGEARTARTMRDDLEAAIEGATGRVIRLVTALGGAKS